MHELGYCEAVLDAVERRAAGRSVARVRVRVGSVYQIVPEAFEMSFQLVAAGGVADGATTEVSIVSARGSCGQCQNSFEAAGLSSPCPRCGSLDVKVEGGDDLILEWVVYRAADADHDGPGEVVTGHSHTHSDGEFASASRPANEGA
ncbi:MAG: hydrogenase maturation nickel metallochaperone HypA [Candidatus Nanopelagicales bacterium]